MIPRELYTHNGSDSNADETNSKYYKHRKVPLAPDEKKLASKKKLQSKYGVIGDETADNQISGQHDKDEDAMDVAVADEIRSGSKNNSSQSAPNNHIDDVEVGTLDDLRQRLQVNALSSPSCHFTVTHCFDVHHFLRLSVC